MRGEGGKSSLLPEPARIVPEEQPDRGNAHGRAVAIRSTGEILFGDLTMISTVLHRFENSPSAATITARRHVIFDKGFAQIFLDDLPFGNQRFRHPNGHLRIVGVPDLFLRISDQGFGGWKAAAQEQGTCPL